MPARKARKATARKSAAKAPKPPARRKAKPARKPQARRTAPKLRVRPAPRQPAPTSAPANATAAKAEHDHVDPRGVGDHGVGQSTYDAKPVNWGAAKVKSVARLDKVSNWFRRGRGR